VKACGALAAFSQAKLINMSRSAALLSPMAYLGQIPSLLAKAAADLFVVEVTNEHFLFNFGFQECFFCFLAQKIYIFCFYLTGSVLVGSGEFVPGG
jgi:hypothetical protein